MTTEERLKKLTPPDHPVHIVIDTDTAAEVDDQFAISYAIRSAEDGEVLLDAVYAAPFPFDWNNIDPKKGVEASFTEIQKVIGLCESPLEIPAFIGSPRYMRGDGPVDSPAVRDLIARGMARPADDPLYVISIGAPTNIGSALALEPHLADHLVVCFLGGNGMTYPHVNEYNLSQDQGAFNAIVDSGVPLVLFPARPCISHLLTTTLELDYYLRGKSTIGTYLCDIVAAYRDRQAKPGQAWSKVIWDIAGVAYAIHPEWFVTYLTDTPKVDERKIWLHEEGAALMRCILYLERDPVFTDLFKKLAR